MRSPEALPVSMGKSAQLDSLKKKTWIPWDALFRGLDRAWKGVEKSGVLPLRKTAIARAATWMRDRFVDSDGLGAIFPPIVWSVVALRCLGYADDSPEVRGQLQELEKLSIREGTTLRLEPCKSPVWDTAIATLALREAGVTPDHPSIRRSVKWMLSKECRKPGDWSLRAPADLEPSGWYFEFRNEFYPDVDDTCMVLMALARTLPEEEWQAWRADLLLPAAPRRVGPGCVGGLDPPRHRSTTRAFGPGRHGTGHRRHAARRAVDHGDAETVTAVGGLSTATTLAKCSPACRSRTTTR